jgi:hypothetical protein
MLTQIPRPSAADVAERSERAPMSAADRWQFFARHATGLSVLVLAYLLINVLRNVRNDFAPEIWRGLGVEAVPALYTYSEILVAFGVVVLNGMAVFIRDNRRAFFTANAIALGGLLLVIGALVARTNCLDAFSFMVLIGLGLYLPYVAIHTTIFERLIAVTRDRGNIGYLMYLADAFGYLGYVGVMIAKNFVQVEGDFLGFFVALSWAIALGGIALFVLFAAYFALRVTRTRLEPAVPAV